MRGHTLGNFCARLYLALSLCFSLACTESLGAELLTSFSFEPSTTAEEHAWGLMARRTIPRDHGMLFIFNKKDFLSLWAFNCKIDFSVAFIDDSGKILSIQDLAAHPDKMRDFPPIETLSDLAKVDWNHPNISFFREQAVKSPERVRYALEMRLGWFRYRGVQVGDYIEWDLQSRQGRAIRLNDG